MLACLSEWTLSAPASSTLQECALDEGTSFARVSEMRGERHGRAACLLRDTPPPARFASTIGTLLISCASPLWIDNSPGWRRFPLPPCLLSLVLVLYPQRYQIGKTGTIIPDDCISLGVLRQAFYCLGVWHALIQQSTGSSHITNTRGARDLHHRTEQHALCACSLADKNGPCPITLPPFALTSLCVLVVAS